MNVNLEKMSTPEFQEIENYITILHEPDKTHISACVLLRDFSFLKNSC